MIVYRLCKSIYSKDLSGKGAEICGGRWNTKGTPMIYTSESRALCLAELAVHLPLGIIPTDFVMVSIQLPDNAKFKTLNPKDLPQNWASIPPDVTTQFLGSEFIRANSLLFMKVPSAIVHDEWNILINPNHKLIDSVHIVDVKPFAFDGRLFKA